MEITFHVDADTGLPHCYAHGVDEREVAELLANATVRLRGRGNSFMALGQTDAGRHLKVIYRKEDDNVFVITAFDLRGKALAAFRRRRRRRGER